MLAIGPFAQQVVSVSFKEVMTGQSSIGRALNGTEMELDSLGNGKQSPASLSFPSVQA